jgi:ribosome-binding protein aMBF1 (putative translation factor)
MFNAHRLVYEVFVGPIPEGMQINHKNGIKDDNRPENLEVVTASENKLHAHRVLGLPGNINSMPGETNPRAKVNWDQVREIRRRYAVGGISQQALADEFRLDQTVVSRIVRGTIWKEPIA